VAGEPFDGREDADQREKSEIVAISPPSTNKFEREGSEKISWGKGQCKVWEGGFLKERRLLGEGGLNSLRFNRVTLTRARGTGPQDSREDLREVREI